VYRSIGTVDGPWEAIASGAATTAVLQTTKLEPYALNGTTLILTINGLSTRVTTTFAGPDPYTAAAAAADIAAALAGLGTATDNGGYVRVVTTDTGTDASIEVYGGTGYPYLGFQSTDYSIGTDAAIALAGGTQDYEYKDYNGSSSYYYRYRFYNSGTGDASLYSVPFQVSTPWTLASSDLITGTCKLVDLRGRADQYRRIQFRNLEPTQVTSSGTTYNIFGTDQETTTDADGYAEMSLIKGALVEVAFIGTDVRRRIRVPSSGSEFDLLDSTLSDDEFGIQEPTLRIMARRSP